jgi:hypothetical protein
MRKLLWASLVGAVVGLAMPADARAQAFGVSPAVNNTDPGLNPAYAAPGNYATTWGVPSFGWPRTYTVFASPYGPGYGYGYYPYMYVPGNYGFRLWRPGYVAPGYVYGAGYYGTVATPYLATTGPTLSPPMGYYAPGFGAPAFYAW